MERINMRSDCELMARKRGNYVTHSTDNRDLGNLGGLYCIEWNSAELSYS